MTDPSPDPGAATPFGDPAGGRAFVDLHCHTRASFDSLASPRAVVEAAAARGLTHLAITDHDRIDGALEAAAVAPRRLAVIVGEEIRTRDGDLIGVYLERAIPPGLSARETIAAIRAQGGLVGIPHPFDRFRGSRLRTGTLDAIVDDVDWVEGWNARLVGGGNERAARLATERGLSVAAVSDAHTTVEVGVAYTILDGPIAGPGELLAALPRARLVTGRASYLARLVTPVAKLVQRSRGQGRVRPDRLVATAARRDAEGETQ
jgi:predicted metal-dependent phosphoesterase TrpH